MTKEESPRVLVIEDDDALRLSLENALQCAGYDVRCTSDGRESVALAHAFRPLLVVCDVCLPTSDGPSILSSMRADPQLELTQFVLMTGHQDNLPQRAGMDLGADDYLEKPFTLEAFLRAVEARVRRAQRYRQADERALLKLRDTVSRRLPHELLTPLTGILGLSEVLMTEIEHTTPAEALEMISDVHRSAERLHHSLRNYFGLLDVLDARPSLPAEAIPAAALPTLVGEAVRTVAARLDRAADVSSQCEALTMPLGEANLSAILTELLDNACRYSARGTAVNVVLRRAGGRAELVINDQGRGLTSQQIAQIGAFRQFDRTAHEHQGLGVGLTLAQHLIARSGGRFVLESERGIGTTATASWPLPE